MTIFVTSDLHFSHVNLLKYCPIRRSGKPLPELGSDEYTQMVIRMNELIIRNWNSMVEPDDVVVILGDVAMGKIENAPSLISRLNGKKYLVKGNHDKTLVKLIKNNPQYSDLFVWIKDVYEMTFKLGTRKIPVFMSHYPHVAWAWSNPDVSKTSVHLHGHLHGSPSGIPGAILDVGMDTNNLYPYRMEQAIEMCLANAKKNPSKGHHS